MENGNSTVITKAGELAGLILDALVAVGPAINKEMFSEKLSFKQLLLMIELAQHRRGMTMTDIARWCGNSTAAATGIVDRLEKLDHVQRRRPRDDRRTVIVTVTESGRYVLRKLEATVATELGTLLDDEGADGASDPETIGQFRSFFGREALSTLAA